MGEDDIRKYLNSHSAPGSHGGPAPKVRVVRKPAAPAREEPQETFRDFSATHMFCGTCRRAMPVRERLLLFLPDGDLYDYQCEGCGGSTGTRKVGR